MHSATKRSRFLPVFLGVMAIATVTARAPAQDAAAPGEQKSLEGVPVITGNSGFITDLSPGQQHLGPVIAPIILVPIGSKALFEAEGEFEGSYDHATNQPWEHHWDKGLEYGQFDIFLNRYVTVVAGRFLTPFGIYNEGLHPTWIRNMLDAPIITGIEMTDSNGAELRGAIPVTSDLNLTYETFFSAATTVAHIEATRAAGSRFAAVLPNQRLTVGVSYQRILQDEHSNIYGFDLTYQLTRIPLDIRGEYARSRLFGSGYWVEGAYRMRKVPLARKFMRKSQTLARWQQYVAPGMMPAGLGDMGLPAANTREADFGWNYYLRDNFKVGASFGRSLSPAGDSNVVTLGIGYRFTFPLGGGK
jgi:hypothetical protein